MTTNVKLSAKLSVWERDQWKCRYCGDEVARSLDGPPHAPHHATVDHVVPRASGGTNVQSNLVTACYRCNQAKGVGLIMPATSGPTLADVWPDLSPGERSLFADELGEGASA